MAKYCILGSRGFIGKALANRLGEYSWYPTDDTKVIFHFDSPVHPPFEENPEYFFNKIMTDFLYLLPYCKRHNIKFVYASSALVYEKDTNFVKQKKILEMMASMYPNTLGLRIFPVYGSGEDRTVISQWCKAMKNGESPVVWGDGTQARDFIHIDDVVEQIVDLINKDAQGVYDVGVGKPVSFNEIIATINRVLGTSLSGKYVEKPKDYSQGIVCHSPGEQKISLEDGIRKILLEQQI